MPENKTKPTEISVADFLNTFVEDDKKREDSKVLIAMMEEVTGLPPKMWGPSIIGFGQYHYKYASGHEGNAPLIGFSPRKANFSLYLYSGFAQYHELLTKLGKHKTAKACLYINKLADVDHTVLRELITKSYHEMLNSDHGIVC